MADIVDELEELAVLQENGSYVGLKTNRDALRKAKDEIERLRDLRRPCECGADEQCAFAKERDEARAEIERLRDALENLLIAIGMGWDLDGVVAKATDVLHKTEGE